ncbi:MAG TPA: hydroxyisourate hydrolase [Phototrophicaceae bacterium]|nr:hydroxyisourate hydrolase [Phototrophicaceae bacterium]
MTSYVTTHVLDAARGAPAVGVRVELARLEGETAVPLAAAVTDADGRTSELGPPRLDPGTYRVTFATGEYFRAQDVATFYPRVSVEFLVEAGEEHYHVPCLLSPYAYSTYRGS